MKQQHSSMRKVFPKSKGPSKKVDRVEVTANGITKEVTKPKELVNVLQSTNKQKYRCTENTPLMSKQMHKKTWQLCRDKGC